VLDSLAYRYKLLPSEVLARADTLDYMVMDVSVSWERLQRERAEAKSRGVAPPAPALSINKMKEMVERVRRHDG